MKKTESGHVWVLFLNDMRACHSEDLTPVARSDDPEKLVAFLKDERVEPYQDPTGLPAEEPSTEPSSFAYKVNPGHWHKVFRRGGPLEWFNDPQGCPRIQRIASVVTLDRSDDIALLLAVL